MGMKQACPQRGLLSNRPATKWQEALVTGNGTMGIMVMGVPTDETIIFNHERLYEPVYDRDYNAPRIAHAMPEIKRLIREGKSAEAVAKAFEEAQKDGVPDLIWTDAYHPAFAMHVQHKLSGEATDYARTVDFGTGEVCVSFWGDAGSIVRKAFVSRADALVVQLIEGDAPVTCSLQLALQDPTGKAGEHAGKAKASVGRDELTYVGGYATNVRGYGGLTRVIRDGGVSKVVGDKLEISGATSVLLLTRIESVEDLADLDLDALRASLAELPADYSGLLKRHVAIHGPIFMRMSMDLNGGDDRLLSTEELIEKQKIADAVVPAFLERMFDMGRFAFLCASGEWPPNLMGIWNGEWRPAWSGDFTTDANINLQIAGANIGNTVEGMKSYTRLIEGIIPDWRTNAQSIMGCRGVMAGTRTDGRHNRHTHGSKGFPGYFWVAGAQWLALPMIEYYEVTGDEAYLKKSIYPLLKEIVLFFEDYLQDFDADGNYEIIPSYSPENRPGNFDGGATINATMDIAVIRESLTYMIDFARKLKKDEDEIPKWEAMLEKIPPYLVNDDGALKEWAHPDIEDHYDHRHVSHLYPVWPGHEIDPDDTPKLYQAAKQAAHHRGRGNGSAHGLAHMAFIGSRLREAELVHGNLKFILSNDYILPSLFTYHNPGRIYNSDMLCCLPGVLIEMLQYSRPGVLELIPALSEEMSKGCVKGVRCRGQITIDAMSWDFSTRKLNVTLRTKIDQTIKFTVRRGIEKFEALGCSFEQADGKSGYLTLDSNQSVDMTITLP